jgi:hypothetical protein
MTITTIANAEIAVDVVDVLFVVKDRYEKYSVFLSGNNEYQITKEEYERLKKIFIK